MINTARAWDKERKSESYPAGINPMACRTAGGALSTELRELMESKVILYNILSLEFKLACGENCSKNRKIRAKVDSRIYGRWRLQMMGS